jgi:hypothetical protein
LKSLKRHPLLPSAELQFDGNAGTFNIEARVIDTNNVTVAALQPRTVSVSEPAQVPLSLGHRTTGATLATGRHQGPDGAFL